MTQAVRSGKTATESLNNLGREIASFSMQPVTLRYPAVKLPLFLACVVFFGATAGAQLRVELNFKRLQYVAYEPVVVTVGITNLAGRDVDLRDANGQQWFGFEVTDSEGRPVASLPHEKNQPPLRIEAGKKVTQRIDLASLYGVHDFSDYHIRAHIYFADLDKFFYSQGRVIQVSDARRIWQQTVGIPASKSPSGKTRTYSLLTNRFPDHTSLYVRVEDKETGVVYATYSLGHTIAFDEPHAEIDRTNQLHVLHCVAPRVWRYSRIGLNGELLAHSSFVETKTRPHFIHVADGTVGVHGGMLRPIAGSTHEKLPNSVEESARTEDD